LNQLIYSRLHQLKLRIRFRSGKNFFYSVALTFESNIMLYDKFPQLVPLVCVIVSLLVFVVLHSLYLV